MSWRRFERAILTLVLSAAAAAQDLGELAVGHRVVVCGAARGDAGFVASEIELTQPQEEELIGTITEAADDRTWVQLLGMRVPVDEDTRWRVDTGELLQPELSNLEILTLGVGRRFGRRHSVDVVYHAYQQDEPSDRFRSTDIDRRPNGVDRSIGSEWDIILGSRLSEAVHLEFVLATFQPGSAFPSDAEDAYLGRL